MLCHDVAHGLSHQLTHVFRRQQPQSPLLVADARALYDDAHDVRRDVVTAYGVPACALYVCARGVGSVVALDNQAAPPSFRRTQRVGMCNHAGFGCGGRYTFAVLSATHTLAGPCARLGGEWCGGECIKAQVS